MTDEEVLDAYREAGSIWKAAKRLGVGGQSVHERLARLGHPMSPETWTVEELREARSMAELGLPLGAIAAQLGRTYWSVAFKLSRLDIRAKHTNRRKKPKRGVGLTKERVSGFAKKLESGTLTLRRLARIEGVGITTLVDAFQYYEPEVWVRYVAAHSDLGIRSCPGCNRDFVPLTKRQEFCTGRCRETHRRDLSYFGGRRMDAVGLREGVCQLCRKRVDKFLSAHHVLGKENDPGDEVLIALCRGCHEILTRLATRPWVEDPNVVEDLIALTLARRGKTNASVSLEVDYRTEDEVETYLDGVDEGSPVEDGLPS